ncbi:MAG TPA: hypothetical protein DHV55_13290 [Clostridiaceae bacterium]|nr:hypothetical protein [Clostridiaceae bacterium]
MNDKADYIISLLGTNPLPAFLSILKNSDANTKVFLVYTSKSQYNIGTKNIANNILIVLEEKIENIQIVPIECDKSDIKAIDGTINEIFNLIIEDMGVKVGNKKTEKLVLDYSGATKVMSVIFCDRVLAKHIEGLDVVISYLDDNEETIIENTKNSIFTSRPSIKKALLSTDINIQDITRIHGYSLQNLIHVKGCQTKGGSNIQYIIPNGKISLAKKNSGENSISVDSLALKNGRLIIYYQSAYRQGKKDRYKRELFKVKDIAEKLGGSRSQFVYKCDCKEDVIEGLKKDIRRAYEYEMEKRLYILKDSESFVDYINMIIEPF